MCFNSAAHIADAMRSVDEQEGVELEHLVIDGASKDGTLDLLNARAQPWRRVVSEPDAGIYDAMNKGMRLATGDFLGFLNADDMLSGRRVIATIASAARPNIDAVYGDLCYVQQDRTDKILRYWKGGDFAVDRLRYGWMPPHPTFYVRRSTAQAIGAFDLQFRIAADYDFMLRFLSRAGVSVAYLPQVLVRMRTGGASNRSLGAMLVKSREDLAALQKNKIGGLATLVCKNARKIPQFLSSPHREPA